MTDTTRPAQSAANAAAGSSTVTVRCQFCSTWNRVSAARVPDRPKCGKCGRPLLLDRPIPLGDDDFQRTISESELPVMVDFYADWCGPCKVMAPTFDQIAARHQGRALVAKVNTDLARNTASSFDIRGIPTTIVFRNGSEVARQVGAVPGQKLEELLASASTG